MSTRFGSLPPGEDPSVAPVEAILQKATSRTSEEAPRRNGRVVATHAIWLCACETMADSPVWLIYTVGEDAIGWQRLDDRQEAADVVDAKHLTGAHPDPEAVLDWLRGDTSVPYFHQGFLGDSATFSEIRRRVRSS